MAFVRDQWERGVRQKEDPTGRLLYSDTPKLFAAANAAVLL